LNYLSHYFIDHIPDNHCHNTGLILPDVCKKWIKNFHQPLLPHSTSDAISQLHQGTIKHYLADKKFHASNFFNSHVSAFIQAVNQAGLSERVQRKWFIAHIAFELMLDRMLVNYYPEKVDAFYQSLLLVEKKVLKEFLLHFGMPDTEEFFQFYSHFTAVQYIYYYPNNNKFIYSLNRIMMRAGLEAMDETDGNKLLAALLQLENDYFADAEKQVYNLRQIFTE
jgi:hypothetical protein